MADICRKVRRRSFTQIDNEPVNDQSLRYEDIGLLVYVLSKPDNWTIYKYELISSHSNGRESVAGILKRLEERGYLLVIKGRTGKGYFSHNQYIFTDRPFDFGDEYELDETPPGMEYNGKPETPCKTEDSTVYGNPSTGTRQRETVNGNPTSNNTKNNNTKNNNAVDEEQQQKVIDNFQQIFGTDIPAEVAQELLKHSEEEIKYIFRVLKEKKEQGKIVSPRGILIKDTRTVIERILAGVFYADIEKDPEIEEFVKYTGVQIKGQVHRQIYHYWRAKFSKEMMFKAGELTAIYSKNGTIDYMVAILKDWEKRGITKPSQVNKKSDQKYDFTEIFIAPENVKYIPFNEIDGIHSQK